MTYGRIKNDNIPINPNTYVYIKYPYIICTSSRVYRINSETARLYVSVGDLIYIGDKVVSSVLVRKKKTIIYLY